MQKFNDHLRIAWTGKQIQYSLPLNLGAFFSEMFRANKKDFTFRQGNCTMKVLHPFLSKSFALCICSKNSMKTSTLGYFCKITYSQMHRKLQPWCHFRTLLCSFFNLKSLILTLRHMFCSPKVSNIYRERDFVSSVLRNKWEKYTFLWFKKETYLWWEENISEFSKKYAKFFSRGYYFLSYMSPLITFSRKLTLYKAPS